MKFNKSQIWSLVFLIVVAAVYRIIPGRAPGFAPQIAMAIFAGAVIKDRKWAFAFPVFSMFISDLLFQILYKTGVSATAGFYEGQLENYILFALLVFIGMTIKKLKIFNILAASLAAPAVYFLLSNFMVWASSGVTRGLDRPRTFSGLLMCYSDGLPFFRTSIIATLVFSGILFGSYYLVTRSRLNSQLAVD